MSWDWSDLLRISTFVFAFMALGASLGVISRARAYKMRFGQLWRFVSLSIFLTSVLITEIVRINHTANWHTWADFAGSLTGWAGNSVMVRRHFEKHPTSERAPFPEG